MHYLVYRITNTINDKSYIGCHKTENKDDGYMGSGIALKAAIKKYGLDAFKKEILCEAASAEAMFEKEKELVVLGPTSYNLKRGGDGGWDHLKDRQDFKKRGYKNAESFMIDKEKNQRTGHKFREQKIGIFDPKYDAKRSEWAGNAFRGRQHTNDAKQRIAEANRNNRLIYNPMWDRCWIYNLELQKNKVVLKTELNDWLKCGWLRGTKKAFYKT